MFIRYCINQSDEDICDGAWLKYITIKGSDCDGSNDNTVIIRYSFVKYQTKLIGDGLYIQTHSEACVRFYLFISC